MKIKVMRKDGNTETLTVTDPIRVIRGEILNRIVTSTGMEHFFYPDGSYDGWGMSIAEAKLNPDEARAFIDVIEKGREIEHGT